jgi:GAF domain-containing protein
MALVLAAVVLVAVLVAAVAATGVRRQKRRLAEVDHRSTLENLQRLQALDQLGLMDGPRRPELDELTHQAARRLRAASSVVSLVDGTHQHFAGAYGLGGLGDPGLDYSYCKHVVAFDRPVAITDSTTDPLVRTNRATTERGVRAYLGVPLRTSSGQTVGSFCVFDNVKRSWSADDERYLVTLAAEAMRRAESTSTPAIDT